MNPANETFWFYLAAYFIDEDPRKCPGNPPGFRKIEPFKTRRIVLHLEEPKLTKVEITIFDANKSFVHNRDIRYNCATLAFVIILNWMCGFLRRKEKDAILIF